MQRNSDRLRGRRADHSADQRHVVCGRRLEMLRALPRDRVTLQISLDSPTPERHDRHRGEGTWARAWKGIERARAEGFRVRLAATVSTDDEAEEFRQFLDTRQDRRDRIG